MVTLDRIRLTGLLQENPANAGFSHFSDRLCASPVHHGGECLRPDTARKERHKSVGIHLVGDDDVRVHVQAH